ncbi:cystathionine gamma-lyase [Kockovaella imperatae]|uniref:cystathionine gamma-lyase n=1 Tax=Kockovaella imperatae TaxID=4999 RepID=A0A1Y1UGL8_9TREE|nr:cystathionine gamma-lyase [Kockovaella imperatae]ORX37172.1 cystathionine gamma-lyase [Kockovaella imperatae]
MANHKQGQEENTHHYATRSIHVGSEPDPSTGSVVPNLSVATTYLQYGIGKHHGYEYSRSDNPTRNALERLITSLETCPQREDGTETLVYASGSAATSALCQWVSLPEVEGGAGGGHGPGNGGHVLAVNDVYGGTARYLARTAKSTGLEVTFLDMEKAGEEGIRSHIRDDTKIIWLELPTNPMLLVPPLSLISKIVESLPHRPLIVCDTTFLSSYFFTPLSNCPGPPLADIVLSSLSKYSGGHSDIILGSLTVSARVKDRALRGLRFIQNSTGGIPSPRDCHLMIRSLKTLGLRALKHGMNALQVASWLKTCPLVEKVRYPGLNGDGAFHTVEGLLSTNAKRELEFLGWQFPFKPSPTENSTGGLAHLRSLGIPFGGVVSFVLKDAPSEAVERFVTSLKIIFLAESLGGAESLIEVPYAMTHAQLPEETKAALGITHNLIRLSVGIEDAEDLIEDLTQAMRAANN